MTATRFSNGDHPGGRRVTVRGREWRVWVPAALSTHDGAACPDRRAHPPNSCPRTRDRNSACHGWVGLVTVGSFLWASPCPSVGWGCVVWSFAADGVAGSALVEASSASARTFVQ